MPEQQPVDPSRTEPRAPLDAIDSQRPPAGARRGVLTAGLVVLALLAAGLVGGVLARGGGSDQAALAAATGSASEAPQSSDAPRRWRPGPGMRGGPGGVEGALHGTFVVPDGSGGYRTLVMQRGTATAASATSITVRSADGYQQTYDVTSSTAVNAGANGVAGIAKGANVAVVAEKKGSGLSALRVLDLATFRGHHGPGRMGDWRDGPDRDGDDGGSASTPSGAAGSASGA